MIDTLDEKIEHLEKIGIDHIIIHPFDKKFSLLSADQFIKEYLVEKQLKHIIIGYDHRFGKGREASVSDLKEYSSEFNFIVDEIDAKKLKKLLLAQQRLETQLMKVTWK